MGSLNIGGYWDSVTGIDPFWIVTIVHQNVLVEDGTLNRIDSRICEWRIAFVNKGIVMTEMGLYSSSYAWTR